MTSKPIGDNKPTPSSGGKSDIQPGHPKPDLPPVPGVTSLPPSQYHCEITCKQEKHWWDKWKPYVELFGVFLLAVYTGYTIKMYYANRDAANAATSAANTARDTLVVSNRPWVQVKGQLNFEYLGFRYVQAAQGVIAHVRLESGMTYTLENTGNSPAFKVTEAIAPVFPTSTELPNDWRLQACRVSDEMSVGKNMGGVVIMPKGTTDKPHPIRVSAPIPADVKQATFLWIVGCIAYQDTFSTTLHHTKMLYIIRRAKPLPLTNLPTKGLAPFSTDAIQLVDSDAD